MEIMTKQSQVSPVSNTRDKGLDTHRQITIVLLDKSKPALTEFKRQTAALTSRSGGFEKSAASHEDDGCVSFRTPKDQIAAFVSVAGAELKIPHVVHIEPEEHGMVNIESGNHEERVAEYRLLTDRASILRAQESVEEIFKQVPEGPGAAASI